MPKNPSAHVLLPRITAMDGQPDPCTVESEGLTITDEGESRPVFSCWLQAYSFSRRAD